MGANFNKSIFFYLLAFISFIWYEQHVQAEVFTALVDMKSLIYTEKEFNSFVDLYLKAEERRLQNIEKLLNEHLNFTFIETNETDFFVKNPVNAFHLLQQLFYLKRTFFTLMENSRMSELLLNYKNKHQNITFSTAEDFTGVAVAIDRLIDTYEIDVSSIAKGEIFPGANLTKTFTANDCFLLAQQLYLSKMYFKAIPWFVQSIELWDKEKIKTINKNEVIRLLAQSSFEAIGDSRNIIYSRNYEKSFYRIEEALKKIDTNSNVTTLYSTYEKEMKDIRSKSDDTFNDFNDLSYAFRDHILDDDYSIYNKLCQNQQLLNNKDKIKLNCYYMRNKSPYLTLQPTKVEDIHNKPWVALLHDILSHNEIELIKNLSIPEFSRAQIAAGTVSDYRISKSSWLEDFDHPLVDKITQRLQEITGLNVVNGAELLQIVNYGIGGHYILHYDYDDEMESGSTSEEMPMGNRIATVLLYMSDVKAGGATVFPKLNIGVFPKKGSAVFWYNLLKTGQVDPKTHHAACPVLMGSKWVSNKWILEHHQEFRRPCGLTEDDIYLP